MENSPDTIKLVDTLLKRETDRLRKEILSKLFGADCAKDDSHINHNDIESKRNQRHLHDLINGDENKILQNKREDSVLAHLKTLGINNFEDFVSMITAEDEQSKNLICALDTLRVQIFNKKIIATHYIEYLISNKVNEASHVDDQLNGPRGIAVHNSMLWTANNKSDTIRCYDLFGNFLGQQFSIRDEAHNANSLTGICINNSNGFYISEGIRMKPATLLVCTNNGTIHGYNPIVNNIGESSILINQQLTGRVKMYRGLVVADNKLYVADFFNRCIDVFDSSYNGNRNFNFVDDDATNPIPLDYVPNNIVNIGEYLYVLWARQDPMLRTKELHGQGHGFISVFNLNGSFVKRFASRGTLNSPCTMIPAPSGNGYPDGGFLVGNNGDGRINIFDKDGSWYSPMLDQSGKPMEIKGLRGLTGDYSGTAKEVFAISSCGLVVSIKRDQIIMI